jgi:hypothetical protein
VGASFDITEKKMIRESEFNSESRSWRGFVRHLTFPLFLVAFALASAWAQEPRKVGGEFQINTYTTADQGMPSVARDRQGGFVVVWEDTSGQDGSYTGIFGQRFSPDGAPRGGEFQVNSSTLYPQYGPEIAATTAGSFVVAWTSWHQYSNSGYCCTGVFGQRFSADGSPQGSEFQVNTSTSGYQYGPVISTALDGDFVVVWTSFPGDGSGTGVVGRRYDGSGSPLGPEFAVNTFTTNYQGYQSVATAPDGSFVVVWDSYGQDGDSYGVFAQRYAADGSPSGSEFMVNKTTAGYQGNPEVVTDPSGNFVVAWAGYRAGSADSFGIIARRFAEDGSPITEEFQVNTYTTGTQGLRSMAITPAGDLVVVFSTEGADGSYGTVLGQAVLPPDTPWGGTFQVNTTTSGDQLGGSVATDGAGNFVVVWYSRDGVAVGGAPQRDGSGFGIYGQLFRAIRTLGFFPF